MKKAILFALVILIAGAVFGQEFTFRGLPWGSTLEAVIAQEGEPDRNNDGLLTYRDIVLYGYGKVVLHFTFMNNELIMSDYTINASNPDSALLVYTDLLTKLSVLYGEPNRATISLHEKEYYWVVSRTKITLSIGFKQFGPSSGIHLLYESPEYNEFGGL